MKESAPYKKEFIKFIPYLKGVDIVTRTLLKRIEFMYILCSDMCPEEIEDIFIDEYIKEDGTREYEDLNFFSKRYCLCAKNFLTKIQFIAAPMAKRIAIWRVTAQDFDFKKATEKSRLNISFKLLEDIDCEFKATKDNCHSLQAIIKKYIIPNQVTS